MSLFLMSFSFLYILNSLRFLFLFTFCQVCLPVKATAEIETGMGRKVQLGPGKHTAKTSLVWRNRKKISQIIKDYFYLPFFLLIILWAVASDSFVFNCGYFYSPLMDGNPAWPGGVACHSPSFEEGNPVGKSCLLEPFHSRKVLGESY